MKRLQDKVALITGGGSGIGEATAKLFARHGAKVVVAGHRKESAEKVRDAIIAEGGEAIAVHGGIENEADVIAMVDQTIRAYGRIDVLHNNAALTNMTYMSRDQDIVNQDVEIWDMTFNINVRGSMLMCKHVIPHMLRQGGGSIIQTGSGRGLEGDSEYSAYGASKAAQINMIRHIAAQYGKKGIRANNLIVGFVISKVAADTYAGRPREIMEKQQLVPFIGEPEDVANAALFLASDESRFVTGHELFADGGICCSHSTSYGDFLELRAQSAE